MTRFMPDGQHAGQPDLERRLAAILALDVVGFSRMIGLDEEGTLAALKAHRRDMIDPTVLAARGRIIKTMGDGLLAEFSSSVAAVRCAVMIQQGMTERNADLPAEKRMALRIGVHVGDVVVDEADLLGDGVNIAARLEGGRRSRRRRHLRGCLAAGAGQGGCGLRRCWRGPAQEHRRARSGLPAGDRRGRLVRRARRGSEPKHAAARAAIACRAALPEHERRPRPGFFADGLVEDIITTLSKLTGLRVVARNSSFVYKGR